MTDLAAQLAESVRRLADGEPIGDLAREARERRPAQRPGRHVVHPGQVFGEWTVRELVGRDPHRALIYLCRCSCGVEKEVHGQGLARGTSMSCGHTRRQADGDRLRAHLTTHGLSKRPEYFVWKTMRQRCMNPRSADFAEYGGRGIRVHKRWNDFAAFIADMGPRPNGTAIDRRDNDGHYEPSNCRWATGAQQANNRRPRRPRAATPQQGLTP